MDEDLEEKGKRVQKRGKQGRWAQEEHSETFRGVKRGEKMESTGGRVEGGGVGFVGHVSPGCRGQAGAVGWWRSVWRW